MSSASQPGHHDPPRSVLLDLAARLSLPLYVAAVVLPVFMLLPKQRPNWLSLSILALLAVGFFIFHVLYCMALGYMHRAALRAWDRWRWKRQPSALSGAELAGRLDSSVLIPQKRRLSVRSLRVVTEEVQGIVYSRKWFRIWGPVVLVFTAWTCITQRSLEPALGMLLLLAIVIAVFIAFWGALRWLRERLALKGVISARGDVEVSSTERSAWASSVLTKKRRAP